MTDSQSLTSWFGYLNQLFSPTGVLLIGAGAGNSPWIQGLAQSGIRNVTLVEADDEQFQRLQRTVPQRDDWHLRQQVVAASSGPVTFHQASLAAENGLLPPVELLHLWPNLKIREQHARQAIALAELLQETAAPTNWLLLDCLPALPILEGAAASLPDIDLIAARVVVMPPEGAAAGASAEALQNFLQAHGFRPIASEISRHPALGHLLFARDAQASSRTLQQQLDASQQQLARAQAERDTQAGLASERLNQLQQLQRASEQTQTMVAQRASEQIRQFERTLGERDEQARQVADRLAQLLQQQQTAELVSEQARQSAEQQALQLEQATTQRDELARLAEERLQQVAQVERALSERDDEARQATDRLEQLLQQLKQQQQANEQASRQCDELARQAEQARAAAQQQTDGHTRQLQQAVQERDAQTRLAAERQQQLEQLQSATEQRSAEHLRQLAQAAKDRDDQARLAAERLAQLQHAAAEASTRQTEAQLEAAAKVQNQADRLHELGEDLKKQADQFLKQRELLSNNFKKEINNAAKQIEAFIGLQSYFSTGDLPTVNIERHGWPISPDFAVYLVSILETRNYDLIIEFGSGISTTIIAKTLTRMATRRPGKAAVQFTAFDHLEKYYKQTGGQLRQAGLTERVQLLHTQLTDYQAPGGESYPYYDCENALAELAKRHNTAGQRILVLVDGPPASTGKHARYPAGPMLMHHFKEAGIDFLMDDYIRDDEKEIAKMWQDEITAAKRQFTQVERRLEKDACLIMTTPCASSAEAKP